MSDNLKVFVAVLVALMSTISLAQEGLADLNDYPFQAVHENNWAHAENIRWMARNFTIKSTKVLARGDRTYHLPSGDKIDVEALTFLLPGDDRSMTMLEAMAATNTDGYIVLKDGKVVYEKYFDGFDEHDHHSWFSGSKSLIGMAIGILVDQGRIDANKTPADYIPALKRSAFSQVTVRQLLDMTTALAYTFDKDAMKPGHLRYEYFIRAGMASGAHLVTGDPKLNAPRGIRALATLVKPHGEIEPGEVFLYQNINVDVAGWLIEAVSGLPLRQFIRENIWVKLQTEHDALMITDPNYTEQASGGLISTLRDHARFGLAVLNGGELNGERIFPQEWIQQTYQYSDADAQAFANHKTYSGADFSAVGAVKAYKNYWYIYDREQGAMSSRGFAGQIVYLNHIKNVVVVAFSGASQEQGHDRDRLMHFTHLLAEKL